MKIFKIILIVFLTIFILGSVGLFIFLKTLDAERLKDQLTSQLSTQINRKVAMGKLDFSFSVFRGFFLAVEQFQIQDDPKFSNEVLFRVGEVQLDLNVLAFLTQQKLVLSHITVISPEINLVRDASGVLNIQELAPRENTATVSQTNSEPTAVSVNSSEKKEVPSIPQLLIRAIRLEKGKLTFVDKNQEPPVRVQVDDINLNISELSSSAPFKFTLTSSVLSQDPNLDVKGKGQLNLKTLQVRLDDVKVNLDLSAITPSELEKAAPGLKPSELGLTIKGKVEAVMSQVVAGPEGLLLLAATGKLTSAKIDVPKIPLSVQGGLDFEISEKDVNVSQMAFTIGEGTVTGQLRLDDYLKQQRFFCNLEFKNVPLVKSLPEFGPQVNFHGQLNGLVKLNGQGFQSEKLLPGLNGESQLDIQQGVIENFNLLGFILSKITMFPKLDEILVNNLPEGSKNQVAANRTIFDKIDVKAAVKEGKIIVDRAEFIAPVFSLNAQGRVNDDQSLNLTAVLKIAKDLAGQMIASVGELKALEEEDGQLGIPVRITGPAAHPQILPDAEALAKKMILGKGKVEIKGLLDKVLGNEETAPGQEGEPDEGSPEETINNVLDSIFK